MSVSDLCLGSLVIIVHAQGDREHGHGQYLTVNPREATAPPAEHDRVPGPFGCLTGPATRPIISIEIVTNSIEVDGGDRWSSPLP